jgi:hypothetical protein
VSVVEKNYTSAFALETEILSKMVETILAETFNEKNLQFNPEYIVLLSADRRIQPDSLDELITLDNTTKKPIKSLQIKASHTNAQTALESIIRYTDKKQRNITVRVFSNDPSLARRLAADLEEQVERTLLNNNWIYRLFKSGDVFLNLIVGAFITLSFIFALGVSLSESLRPFPNNLPPNVLDALVKQSHTANSVEEKVDFLFDVSSRELQLRTKTNMWMNPQDFLTWLLTWRTAFIVTPPLILLLGALYIIWKYYPKTNFVWGDYEKHYRNLDTKRGLLWIGVIFAVIAGILAGVFVLGLSSYVVVGS